MRSRARSGALTFGLLAALAMAFVVGVLWHHHPRTLTVGDRLPALQLSDLQGAGVQLGAAPPARTTVYNVFTSWCPACNEELPDITRAASILSHRGVGFVGIDQGEAPDRVESFATANGLRYPLLVDSRRITTSRLGARIIPETLVVRDGVVRRIFVGPTTTGEILAAVGALQ